MAGSRGDDEPTVEEREQLEPDSAEPPIEVEPAGDDAADELLSGVAPPDRRLITQPYDLAVGDLVGQVGGGNLRLNPVYQRRYVWDNKKASKLVESLLINVPIPVCYLADEDDGTRSTIDGQQRLRSLYRFLENQFGLTGLEVLPELNGYRYFELTDRQQRLIRNRTIRCIVISEDSDPDIRFDVFERLNTGSVALTAQELRNSVYRGEFNALLHELADSELFRRCVSNRADSRMTFEELLLRFFALDERILMYRPSLKRFLNHYQRDNRDPDEEWLEEQRARATETLERANAVFGGECFRRAKDLGEEWQWLPNLNSAVFDVVMLNFARIDEPLSAFEESARKLEQMTASLTLHNDEFIDAISLATGDRARLHRRVRIYAEGLAEHGFVSGLAEELPSDD